MSISLYTVASGSSGNCYLIYTDETKILLDVGVSGKKIIEEIGNLGFVNEQIDGILLTHEHQDHIKSIRKMSKVTKNSIVFASKGTIDFVEDKISKEKIEIVRHNDELYIGNILVKAFQLSHDAKEALGYTFEYRKRRITVITDSGYITKDIEKIVEDTDLLVLESNYERNVLLVGNYPYYLKKRIDSRYGHLSNEQAAICICNMLQKRNKKGMPIIRLAHLSKENNTPKQAYITVNNNLYEEGFLQNRDYDLDVFPQGESGPIISLKGYIE